MQEPVRKDAQKVNSDRHPRHNQGSESTTAIAFMERMAHHGNVCVCHPMEQRGMGLVPRDGLLFYSIELFNISGQNIVMGHPETILDERDRTTNILLEHVAEGLNYH